MKIFLSLSLSRSLSIDFSWLSSLLPSLLLPSFLLCLYTFDSLPLLLCVYMCSYGGGRDSLLLHFLFRFLLLLLLTLPFVRLLSHSLSLTFSLSRSPSLIPPLFPFCSFFLSLLESLPPSSSPVDARVRVPPFSRVKKMIFEKLLNFSKSSPPNLNSSLSSMKWLCLWRKMERIMIILWVASQ